MSQSPSQSEPQQQSEPPKIGDAIVATNQDQQLPPPTRQQSLGGYRQASPNLPAFLQQQQQPRPQSEPRSLGSAVGYYALEMEKDNQDGDEVGATDNNDADEELKNASANAHQEQNQAFSSSTQTLPMQQQQQQQQPMEEYDLPPLLLDPTRYRAMEDDNNNNNNNNNHHSTSAISNISADSNTQPNTSDKTSSLLHHHSSSLSTSKSSRAARWFALETTPEDRLSYHILATEVKAVLRELLHFFKNRHWKKKLLTILCIAVAVLVFFDLFFLGNIKLWIHDFLIWMTSHPIHAEFAFIGIFVLATLLFVPPTILLIGAGWAFADACGMLMGICAAVISCFLGSIIGSLLSFVRARYMMRDLIELFSQRYPIVRAADQALKKDGFRIMLLLRLCPLIPYHGLNYLGGITGVSWETFLCSLVGMLPYQILVIIMGASAGTLHKLEEELEEVKTNSEQTVPEGTNDHQQLGMIILMSAGVAFFVLAMVLAARFTEKELQKELNIGETEMESYITYVRKMSLIDLYDVNEDQENCEYELEIQHDNMMYPPQKTAYKSSLHNRNSNTEEKKDDYTGINRYVFNPTLVTT